MGERADRSSTSSLHNASPRVPFRCPRRSYPLPRAESIGRTLAKKRKADPRHGGWISQLTHTSARGQTVDVHLAVPLASGPIGPAFLLPTGIASPHRVLTTSAPRVLPPFLRLGPPPLADFEHPGAGSPSMSSPRTVERAYQDDPEAFRSQLPAVSDSRLSSGSSPFRSRTLSTASLASLGSVSSPTRRAGKVCSVRNPRNCGHVTVSSLVCA